MLTVGIRRYTTSRNRGFAFGLYYAVMNIGAFVSGPIVDIFNVYVDGGVTPFKGGMTWSANRLVILTASLVCSCSFFVTYFFMREVRVDEIEKIEKFEKIEKIEKFEDDDVYRGPRQSAQHEEEEEEVVVEFNRHRLRSSNVDEGTRLNDDPNSDSSINRLKRGDGDVELISIRNPLSFKSKDNNTSNSPSRLSNNNNNNNNNNTMSSSSSSSSSSCVGFRISAAPEHSGSRIISDTGGSSSSSSSSGGSSGGGVYSPLR